MFTPRRAGAMAESEPSIEPQVAVGESSVPAGEPAASAPRRGGFLRWLILALVLAAILASYALGGAGRVLGFIQSRLVEYNAFVVENLLAALAIYFVVYVVVTAL